MTNDLLQQATSPTHRRPTRAAERTAALTLPRVSLALVAALVAALALATGADAAIVTSRDNQGRTITFDVRATAIDVEWYASILRAAAHGNEISTVTIRIVPPEQVEDFCGVGAAACYGGRRSTPRIVIPAGTGDFVASTLLHEYGHHLDTAWDVPGVPSLEGTPVWWSARGMAGLFAAGRVALDYSLGWSRSIPEIFAEDYAYIHLPTRYAIPWLTPPDDALRSALLTELGTPSSALPPGATTPGPLVIAGNGTLARGARRVLPFGLLGTGRRVTFRATVSNPQLAGTRARMHIVCNGTVISNQPIGRGRRQRAIDLRNQGPGECQARLLNTSRVRLTYTVNVRLAIET